MTQYKLIKTPEQFIIVSDEEIKEGDLVYHPEVSKEYTIVVNGNINNLKKGYHIAEGVYEHKPTTNPWYKKEKKLIAQQEQIDFNGFEDIVGYVDVEKLHDSLYPKASSLGKRIWIEGFNKANELSSNKEFTLEDMEYCYNTAKRRAVMQEAGLEADLGFKNYIDTYHQQPKEWMIEIAMEFIPQALPQDRYKPKLINGKIQITKIL